MKLSLICATLLAALCAPAWAINKCTGPDSKVVFQDSPCPTGNKDPNTSKKSLTPVFQLKAPRPPMGDEEYERKRAAERSRQIDAYAKSRGAEIRANTEADTAKCGAGTREPHIGASAVWIRNCSTWGEPNKTNSTITAHGESQQWIYRYNRYLYVNGAGFVTAIQN